MLLWVPRFNTVETDWGTTKTVMGTTQELERGPKEMVYSEPGLDTENQTWLRPEDLKIDDI